MKEPNEARCQCFPKRNFNSYSSNNSLQTTFSSSYIKLTQFSRCLRAAKRNPKGEAKRSKTIASFIWACGEEGSIENK